MRTKTVLIIVFTAIITIFLMMNTDEVKFDFIFVKRDISKLLVVGVCTFIGFILGYLVGRPRTTISTYDKELDESDHGNNNSSLSDEDREYIK